MKTIHPSKFNDDLKNFIEALSKAVPRSQQNGKMRHVNGHTNGNGSARVLKFREHSTQGIIYGDEVRPFARVTAPNGDGIFFFSQAEWARHQRQLKTLLNSKNIRRMRNASKELARFRPRKNILPTDIAPDFYVSRRFVKGLTRFLNSLAVALRKQESVEITRPNGSGGFVAVSAKEWSREVETIYIFEHPKSVQRMTEHARSEVQTIKRHGAICAKLGI